MHHRGRFGWNICFLCNIIHALFADHIAVIGCSSRPEEKEERMDAPNKRNDEKLQYLETASIFLFIR